MIFRAEPGRKEESGQGGYMGNSLLSCRDKLIGVFSLQRTSFAMHVNTYVANAWRALPPDRRPGAPRIAGADCAAAALARVGGAGAEGGDDDQQQP